jgi:S-(hydroxymethyl)glutathione dehydrogenase/alcohol dehydrogenase
MTPDYLQGKIKVDEYVTHSRTLAEINKGFDDMHVSQFPICKITPLTIETRVVTASVV